MDRNSWNSVIGFTLIFVIIFVWAKLNSPTPEKLAAEARSRDSIALAEKGVSKGAGAPSSSSLPDSVARIAGAGQTTDSASLQAVAREEFQVLENDKVKITFSNKGGRIVSAQLKEYLKISHEQGSKDDVSGPLVLMQDEANRFDYLLSWEGREVRTGDLFFLPVLKDNALTFTLQGTDGKEFVQEYILKDKYTLEYRIRQNGLDLTSKPLVLEWQNQMERIEKNHEYERIFSTVYYKPAKEDPDYCSCRDSDQQELKEPVKWVSHAHQFFNTTLIADQPFASGDMRTEMAEPDAPNLKLAYSKLVFPALASGATFPMTFYVGPNDYNELKSFGESVEDIIPFGWSLFGSINRHVVRPIFNFLSGFDLNKGIVILLLTLLVKMLLYPLTYKMLKSQATMGALKPKLAHLKEKYKDDAQQQQIETMKIYREFGVNPLGGCMPMLLQMPIWIALYRFFPASIEFRQEGFLWADDLSSYDAFVQLSFEIPFYGDHISLFTLIWVITTIIYTYYSTKDMDMSVNPAMKYLQYFMPIMFLFWFNNYASGLTAYMCISNILNIGQTIVTRNYIIDHEKIKAQLELNKLKPKKKSSFQERLEAALREQQQRQQSQGKGKK